MTLSVAELQKNCIYWQDRAVVLQDEIDRLRAEKELLLEELNVVRTVIPADFLDSMDGPSDPDVIERWRRASQKWSEAEIKSHPPGAKLRTRQVDITMQEDVRANQRRLVEVDDAGNVVVEYVKKRP